MQSIAGEFPVFPEKLRVLLVDDGPVCVKIMSRMLNHCNYQVTEVAKATDAVKTLTKNPKGFDMVITDTQNDIEILSLLVKIMKNESIPVILVSGLEDTSTLIKGVLQGADEVLLKPVSLAKIKNLWQHVYRRRLIEPQPHSDPSPDSGGDQPAGPSSSKNESLSEDAEEEEEVDHKRSKRTRVKWQGTLQEKFTEAVLQLGGPEKAVPKKIMEMINAPDISRESVASHLQKYRKQKKPLVAHHNDTNLIVSSSTLAAPAPPNIRPPVSHPNCFNKPMLHHCFGYHHHHNQGFHYRRLVNSHHFNTANVPFPSRSPSLWHLPKAEPQLGSPFLGQLPDQQQSMLLPLPRCMTPHPIQNSISAPTIPPASVATDHNNYNSFSTGLEEPWIDTSSGSSFIEDTLLMCGMLERDDFGPIFGFQPEDDQWMSGVYPISANGAALAGEQSSDDHQLKIAGDGADGASN